MIEDTVVNFDEWLKFTKEENNKFIDTDLYGIVDINTATFFKDCFTGFMTGPVARINKMVLFAKTHRIEGTIYGLLETKEQLENLKATDDLFLAGVQYFPSHPVYQTIDETTYKPIILEMPYMTTAAWYIRYAKISDATPTTLVDE